MDNIDIPQKIDSNLSLNAEFEGQNHDELHQIEQKSEPVTVWICTKCKIPNLFGQSSKCQNSVKCDFNLENEEMPELTEMLKSDFLKKKKEWQQNYKVLKKCDACTF